MVLVHLNRQYFVHLHLRWCTWVDDPNYSGDPKTGHSKNTHFVGRFSNDPDFGLLQTMHVFLFSFFSVFGIIQKNAKLQNIKLENFEV